MAEFVANNAVTTLGAQQNAGDLTATVVSAAVFANPNFRIQIDNEIELVTAVNGNVLTCVRGQEGTTAATHVIASNVYAGITAGGLAALAQQAGFYTDFAPAGLLGATAASRYVGGTLSGPPTSGTFVLGDWVVSQDGSVYLCIGGGSPGTWKTTSVPTVGRAQLDSALLANPSLTFSGSTPPIVEVDPSLEVTLSVPASGQVLVTGSIFTRVTNLPANSYSDIYLYAQKLGSGSWTKLGGGGMGVNGEPGAVTTVGSNVITSLPPGVTTFTLGWTVAAASGTPTFAVPITTRGSAHEGTWLLVVTQP